MCNRSDYIIDYHVDYDKKFKERMAINVNLAVDHQGNVDMETLNFIRTHNKTLLSKQETHPTTLCGARKVIKDFLLDDYAVGGGGIT